MKEYNIRARYWSKELQSRFGKEDEAHPLSDKEIVDLIREFGRAEIENCVITFHNDYD